MSGGGRSMMRGRMGRHVVATNVNSKDLEKMDVNLKKSEERLRVLGQKQANLDTQINALQPELSKMRLNMQKFSKELQVICKMATFFNKFKFFFILVIENSNTESKKTITSTRKHCQIN